MAGEWDSGRMADISEATLRNVSDHDGLANVVTAMVKDLRACPGEWENATLEHYLDALAAVISSIDDRAANRGEAPPEQPSWSLVADLLVSATVYE